MHSRFFLFAAAAAATLASACAQPPAPNTEIVPQVVAETVTTNARLAPAELPMQPGDCAEALRRAEAKPDLDVDQLPRPVTAKPAALQKVPRSALRKDGSADIKADVLVDTLGKADMSTFTVISSSNKWLVTNVKAVLPKWTFSPALLAGCRVPRVYHFMASAPARAKAAK
jgi:hypothetical protein